jgi:hypothetical protein
MSHTDSSRQLGSGEMARVYAAEFFLGLLSHKLDDEPSRIQQEPES